MKIASYPGASEAQSLDPSLTNEAVRVVSSLFRTHKFCFVTGFNCQRIAISERYADGMGKRGSITWAVRLQPIEAEYTVTAYVDMEWDDNMIRIPAMFKDHMGGSRGFSTTSVKRFLYSGVDLSEYISPARPL